MGKKKKRMQDMWDLTPEEQLQKADYLYEIENGGDVNILSMTNMSAIGEDGLTIGIRNKLRKAMASDYRETDYDTTEVSETETAEDYWTIDGNLEKELEAVNYLYDNLDNSGESVPKELYSRMLRFNVNKDMHRLTLDDGIAPTAFSFDVGLCGDYDVIYPPENYDEMVETLLLYIISLKHPTAIYDLDDFVSARQYKFNKVKNNMYDNDSFIFIRHQDYIFAYMIDIISYNEFHKFLDELECKPNEKLQVLIALAYAAGTMNQAFMSDDDWYLKGFINSEYNMKEEFYAMFIDDEDTVLIDNDATITEEDGVILFSMSDIKSVARESINTMRDEDDDMDDEDDDEESDEDDDEPYEEESFPDIDVTEPLIPYESSNKTDLDELSLKDDEINEMPSDNEVSEDINEAFDTWEKTAEVVEKPHYDKIEASDDDDDFTIPVIRKN